MCIGVDVLWKVEISKKDIIFVELIFNDIWGIGFNKEGIENIKIIFWFGKNFFG